MTMTSPEALLRLGPADGPLAGRTAELHALATAWERAVAGRGGVLLIGGEAGVGKTRLASELAAQAEASGGTVLVGRCPAGGADPYQSLVEALGPVRPVPGTSDRDALFAAMGSALVRRARQSPVLILLDDVHAADRSTVHAVRRIAAQVAEAPVLIVGTYRESVVDRSSPLADLLGQPGVEHLTIEGLTPADFMAIYDDPELARRLWRRSGGNPVIMGELLRLSALDETGPAAFDELVASRVERMDGPARRVLEAAAVVGTEFAVGVVAAAAGLSTDRTAAALGRATVAGFVVAEAGAPATRRFLHDMVREAIVHRIDPAVRVRLHRRVAKALETSKGAAASPALLAWHFRAGAPVGGSTAVLRHAWLAGDRAMEVLAWEAAAEHYGHALGAAPAAPPATRADLLLALGEAQHLAGETTRARQAFLEAAGVARRSHDAGRLARAASALGQVPAVWGADPALEGLAAEAGSGHEDHTGRVGHPDHPTRGGALPAPPRPVLASKAFFASEQLYDMLDGVTAGAPSCSPEPAGDPGLHPAGDARRRPATDAHAAALLRARHAALAGPERAVERLATADDMVALAARTGDHELAAAASGRRMVDLLELGRLDEAAIEQLFHAGVPGRLGLASHARDIAAWSAMRALVEGRAADARTAAEEAFRLATEASDPDAAASFLLQRWAVALEWGTVDELVAVADECDSVGRAGGGSVRPTWRAMAALALARGGEDELAAEELRRAADRGLGPLTRDPSRLHPLTCLAEAAWLLGDATAATALAPVLEPFAASFVVAGRGLAWRGSVARSCAMVAATTGRWTEAEEHIRTAVAAHRRAGALPLLARTRLEEARILIGRGRRGDRRRASDSRRSGTELAARLALTGLAAEAS